VPSDASRIRGKPPARPAAPDRRRLLEWSDVNAVAALRFFTLRSGGEVSEPRGALLAASPHDYVGPFHNAAAPTDEVVSPSDVVEHGLDFFGERGRGFVLWVPEHAHLGLADEARERGLRPRHGGGGAPGMALTRRIDPPVVPEGMDLQVVADATAADEFASLVADAFAMRARPQPRPASLAMFADARLVLDPMAVAMIVRIEGRPVAGGLSFLHAEAAGLYWISTIQELRGRGLAGMVTRALVQESFARGAEGIVLQASASGAGVYRRLGFVDVTRYVRFIAPPRLQDAR
jgi:ribosomal protein S18 acetylase RimI-like enzyme